MHFFRDRIIFNLQVDLGRDDQCHYSVFASSMPIVEGESEVLIHPLIVGG